jgi:hypothetical protein
MYFVKKTKMKNSLYITILLFSTITGIYSCKKKDKDDLAPIDNTIPAPLDVGTLNFKTLNPLTLSTRDLFELRGLSANPSLTGDTTETINTSLKLGIGDIWVSMGEVKAGSPDNLEWIRLTDVTNYELKLFEDYSFSPKELPIGTYKSIKITFRYIFYRYVELVSDPSVKYELLETMGSSTDPCNENDESWAVVNYFSPGGNHKLNNSGLFEVVASGEKVGGFTIEKNKTTNISFRLGGGATEPCKNFLVDKNNNRVWDCGTDELLIECPPEMEYMFDFVID